MVDYTFRTLGDQRDLKRLRGFLHRQGLWYPDYERWIENVCIPDLERGYKSAVVAYSNGVVIGDCVWQPHKELPRTGELKNLRVLEPHRNRDIGHFLLRQAEEEMRGAFDIIIGDTDSESGAVINLLRVSGYRELHRTPLYTNHRIDVVFTKDLTKRRAA